MRDVSSTSPITKRNQSWHDDPKSQTQSGRKIENRGGDSEGICADSEKQPMTERDISGHSGKKIPASRERHIHEDGDKQRDVVRRHPQRQRGQQPYQGQQRDHGRRGLHFTSPANAAEVRDRHRMKPISRT